MQKANKSQTHRLISTHCLTLHIYAILSLTFDNNYVGRGPSAIDVALVSAAADAQRAADVPHLAPAARAAHPPRRNSRGSRCLS